MAFSIIRLDPKSNVVTKGKLECDEGRKWLILISKVCFFEALSNLYSHTVIGSHEDGKVFGNLG